MHDPMVVAWEIPSPIPHRKRWRDAHYSGRRWGFTRMRRTNAECLGEPVYRWWRPAGWTFAVAGRVFGLGRLATIWHVEPKGRDSGEVCKHWRTKGGEHVVDGRWRWHVWHWHLQIPFLQGWRARLFDRCAECGRKGSPNVSHQWDGPGVGWRKWRSRPGLYHGECSNLVSARRTISSDEALVRHLFAGLAVRLDLSERALLDMLTDPTKRALSFGEGYRLQRILGYEWDQDTEQLVKKAADV